MNLHGDDEPSCFCSCLYSILKGSPSSSHKWQRHFAVELSLSWRVCACYSLGTEIQLRFFDTWVASNRLTTQFWFLTRCTSCLPIWELTLFFSILRNGVLMLSLILELFWFFNDPKLVHAAGEWWEIRWSPVEYCTAGPSWDVYVLYTCACIELTKMTSWLKWHWFCKFGKEHEMGDD